MLPQVVPQGPSPHRVWEVLRKPHLPLLSLAHLGGRLDPPQFLEFVMMPSVTLHQNLRPQSLLQENGA